MLPDYVRTELARLNRHYPAKIEGYAHFYDAADPSPALITRCHMNFAFGYVGKTFTPAHLDQNGFWSFSDEKKRDADAEDLLALSEMAVQELRRGYERFCDYCARVGEPQVVPEDWQTLKLVWTAKRAILRDYAEECRNR